jgi:hypothetical protein
MVRNKQEKFEGKGETIFDTPFMIQSHAENMKKIVGVLLDLSANLGSIMTKLAVLVCW